MNKYDTEEAWASSPVTLRDYVDSNPSFQLRFNIRRVLACMLAAALGCGMIYAAAACASLDEQDAFALTATGVVVIILAFTVALFGLKYRAFAATGARLKHVVVYYDIEQLSRVRRAIEAADVSQLQMPKFEGAVRVEAFIGVDDSVVCLQISEYVDFNYHPVIAPAIFTDSKAQPLIDFLKLNS